MIPNIASIVATYLKPTQLLTFQHWSLHFTYNACSFMMTPQVINYIFNHFPNMTVIGLHISHENNYFNKIRKITCKGMIRPSEINKSLHKLKYLYSDYAVNLDAFITNCPNIRALNIYDLSGVFSHTNTIYNNITHIHLNTTQSFNFPQHKFPNLRHIRDNCLYSNISKLALKSLRSIVLNNSFDQIIDLNPLSSCIYLRSFTLINNTSIYDLTPLSKCPSLCKIKLINRCIISVAPLRLCPKLRLLILHAKCNGIYQNLDALQCCKKLNIKHIMI